MNSNTDEDWVIVEEYIEEHSIREGYAIVNPPIEEGYTLVHTNLSKVFTVAIIFLQVIKELFKKKTSEHFSYFKGLIEIEQLRQLQQILCIITQEVNLKYIITKENVKHDFSNVHLIKEFIENQYADFLEGKNTTISNLFYCINSFHAKS